MFYYLYQITNKLNNKIYIGVHRTQTLDDDYMGSGKILKQAIKKHGIENFEKIILEQFDNEKDMYSREAEIVNKNFFNRNDVYNISLGGRGSGIIEHTQETKEKISKATKNHWDSLSEDQRKKSKETKEKMSQANKKRFSSLSDDQREKFRQKHLGRKVSDETRKKIGQANKMHFSSLSKEEKDRRIKKLHKNNQEYWNSLSEDQRKRSKETKEKLSTSHYENLPYKWLIIFPNGHKEILDSSLRKFCKKKNLDRTSFTKTSYSKGFKCQKIYK